MLRRGLCGLLIVLLLAAIAIASGGSGALLAAAPVLAGLLLLQLYRDIDPAGWVFEAQPAGSWRCRGPQGEPRLSGDLRSHGRFPALLWLELQAQEGGAATAGHCAAAADATCGCRRSVCACVSRHRRRDPRQWLICRDALADDDWRRLRRELRLRAAAAQPPTP